MGLTPKFNDNDLKKLEKSILDDLMQRSIRAALYIGEQLVIHAKTNVGFMDQSGNLRSSIGYVLFVDGQVKAENYVSFSNDNTGIEKGKALAIDIASTIKSRIVLVVTAGMNYAHYVEAKGYNVLTATEQEAKQTAKRLLTQLLK